MNAVLILGLLLYSPEYAAFAICPQQAVVMTSSRHCSWATMDGQKILGVVFVFPSAAHGVELAVVVLHLIWPQSYSNYSCIFIWCWPPLVGCVLSMLQPYLWSFVSLLIGPSSPALSRPPIWVED